MPRLPQRNHFLQWKEGRTPQFVLEVLAPSSAEKDQGEKLELYERLGVREYWMYDPKGTDMSPRLQGRRLREGRYERLASAAERGEEIRIHSEVLNLDLVFTGERLRLWDPVGREFLRTLEESERQIREDVAARKAAEQQIREHVAARAQHVAARKAAERQIREDVAARKAAERQIRELQRQIRRLKNSV